MSAAVFTGCVMLNVATTVLQNLKFERLKGQTLFSPAENAAPETHHQSCFLDITLHHRITDLRYVCLVVSVAL